MNELILISTIGSVILVPLILFSKYMIKNVKKCRCCCCSIETKENNNNEENNKQL
jgi:hypothetical protein